MRDVFVRNGCNITCAFCHVPFREREFVSVVSDEAFDTLKRARDDVAELRAENRLRGEFEARVERLRQELARGQDAHSQKITRHRLHIAENILTLKCPRAQCRRAFIDYSGCMALSCQCGCGFCAWCLADCGADAHAHVLQCPSNIQRGSYGGTLAQFNTAHRTRVQPLVRAYLATVPPAELAEVSSRHCGSAGDTAGCKRVVMLRVVDHLTFRCERRSRRTSGILELSCRMAAWRAVEITMPMCSAI